VIFGIVKDGVFYGERAECKALDVAGNGVYSMDPSATNPLATFEPANLTDAIAAFRKYSTMQVIRGVSFHSGIVPDQPVKYPNLPLEVVDGQFGEFEYIEVVAVRGKFLYYLQTIHDATDYVLTDVAAAMANVRPGTRVIEWKGATPAIRVAIGFHLIERRKKLAEEPVAVIKSSMAASGAMVTRITPRHDGYEVVWKLSGHTINTVLSKDFRVMEAGFCTSGGDRSQSARSLPNLLKTYVEEGSYIHRTRQ